MKHESNGPAGGAPGHASEPRPRTPPEAKPIEPAAPLGSGESKEFPFGPEGNPSDTRKTESPDRRRLRRRGQDPMLDRGVDAKEMWRIFRIISEFVEGVDELREIRP